MMLKFIRLFFRREIAQAYECGQYNAFNRVLEHINTYEDKYIDKHKIYSVIFDMRPK